jgi:hypothetical protein
MLKRLWNAEGGAILSAELIILMTMLVIGLMVGLHAVQSALVTELTDVGQAIGAMNQSFSFPGFAQNSLLAGNTNGSATGNTAGNLVPGVGSTGGAATAGSLFLDSLDLDDIGPTQPLGGIGQSVTVLTAPVGESGSTTVGGGVGAPGI